MGQSIDPWVNVHKSTADEGLSSYCEQLTNIFKNRVFNGIGSQTIYVKLLLLGKCLVSFANPFGSVLGFQGLQGAKSLASQE